MGVFERVDDRRFVGKLFMENLHVDILPQPGDGLGRRDGVLVVVEDSDFHFGSFVAELRRVEIDIFARLRFLR